MSHPYTAPTGASAPTSSSASTAGPNAPPRYATVDERLRALRGLADSLDALTRTSPILEALAESPPAPVPYGARTPEIAREAADLVNKRRDKNFRNAPFTGDDILALAEELRFALSIKAKADAFAQLAAQAAGGCSGRTADWLRAVVRAVNAGLLDPFNDDRKGLEADSAGLRALIDAYNASVQSSKATLGALRGENGDLLAQIERLTAENESLRAAGTGVPLAPRPAELTRGAAQPAARRGRRSRR